MKVFLRDIGIDDVNDICPQCREELGVMDLPGFGRSQFHGNSVI